MVRNVLALVVGTRKGLWHTGPFRSESDRKRWRWGHLHVIVGEPRLKYDHILMRTATGQLSQNVFEEIGEELSKCRRDIDRGDLQHFGLVTKCRGSVSMLRGTARQAHIEGRRTKIEEGLQQR